MRALSVAVIPAHDEGATVGTVVTEALRHVDTVLVIDDGSHDATGAIARTAGATVHRQDPNRGKGAALARGLDEALALGAVHVVTLDADGEHDPAAIPGFLSALEQGADVALGHREVYRSGARKALNALALFWFRLLDPAILDTICGFRAFRAGVLPGLRSDAAGFAYEHDVLIRAVSQGLRLAAVPIATTPRERSHVTPRELLRANNHFDRRVLSELGALPIPAWRKGLLAAGCVTGLALGVPTAWALDRRAPPHGTA